jgi:hypothetical protein
MALDSRPDRLLRSPDGIRRRGTQQWEKAEFVEPMALLSVTVAAASL